MNEFMDKTFSNRLKKLRNDTGLSQAKLANILNVAQQTVDKWENEYSEPDIKMLKRLANFFDVTVDYLVGASNEIIKYDQHSRGNKGNITYNN